VKGCLVGFGSHVNFSKILLFYISLRAPGTLRRANMHCHNLIPLVMTIPMAVFYGLYTFTPDSSIRTIPDAEYNSPSCNCTKPFRFKEAGFDIMTKLTEINIPKESRVEILNMLDTLDWVEVKPSCNSREVNFDFIHQLLNNKTDLFWLLLINSCSFMILHAVAQDTIFGVMLKILLTRAWDFGCHLQKSSTEVIQQSVIGIKKITTVTAVTSDEDESCDADDEVFLQCSSMNLPGIDKEEIHPKASDLDEKLDFSNGDLSMSEADSRPFLTTSAPVMEEDIDELSDVDDASPPQSVEVNSPERFKKFLHQKHEDVEKLGIGLTDLEDDLVDR